MTTQDLLEKLLLDKTERQAELNIMNEQLHGLNSELSSSKFSRWFGSSYLFIKRFLTLLVGILLVIAAIYMMVAPETIFNEKFTSQMVEESKNGYFEMIGATIGETVIESIKSGEQMTASQINREFTKAFEHILLEEFYSAIRFVAILLIPLGIFFLYISRLTRKMRIRNAKISEAQSLTQNIIVKFQEQINNAEQDVQIIRGIVNEKR